MPKIINLLSYHVAENIEKYILQNNIKPGTKLPSERELSSQYNVTRVTLRNALQRLIDNGTIYIIPNNGYFVSPKKVLRDSQSYFFPSEDKYLEQLAFHRTEINNENFSFSSDILNDYELYKSDISITKYIETVSHIPIALTIAFQKKDTLEQFPDLLKNNKPTNILQEQRISIYIPKENEKRLLNLLPTDTVFRVSESITYKKELIAVCESICVGTRCELQLNIKTK